MLTPQALAGQARTLGRAVLLALVLAVLLGTAFGFLVAALYIALAQAAGTPLAAALTALALLLLAALLVAAARTRRPPPAADPSAALRHDLATMVRDNPLQAVLLALTTGFSAGAARRP